MNTNLDQEFTFSEVTCPICGNKMLDGFDICKHCYWEYDGCVEDSQYSSCNHSTVKKYRKKYLKSVKKNSK